MFKKLSLLVIFFLVMGMSFYGCDNFLLSSDSGELKMFLADLPVNEVDHVYVTLSEVQVQKEGSPWETINDFGPGGEKFDLLELRFDEALLGEQMLEEGEYNQIRLIVGAPETEDNELPNLPPYDNEESYIVKADGTEHPIFIPSGEETGLKIHHNFTIEADTITEIVLDVDVREMLNEAGKSNIIILRPTAIQVVDRTISGEITGRVIDSETEEAISDRDVIITALDKDNKEVAETVASTEEDNSGNPAGSFKLRGLLEGDYHLKIEAEDYNTKTTEEKIEVQAGETTTLDKSFQIEKED